MEDAPTRKRWATLGVTPPRQPPSRIEALRFIRDLNFRVSLAMLPGVLVVLLIDPATWLLVVVLVGFFLVVFDVLYLTLKLRGLSSG